MIVSNHQACICDSIKAQLKDDLQLEADPDDPIHEVGDPTLAMLHMSPQQILNLAHDKLYAYPYDQVPLCWLRCYEEAQLWSIVVSDSRSAWKSGRSTSSAAAFSDSKMQKMEHLHGVSVGDIVRRLDIVIIKAGAPKRRSLIENCFKMLYQSQIDVSDSIELFRGQKDGNHTTEDRPLKRQRLTNGLSERASLSSSAVSNVFPKLTQQQLPDIRKPLVRCKRPSLASFEQYMHSKAEPMILTNTIDHWPALEPCRWGNPHYWMQKTLDGMRLVPVELGRSYTDESWGQRLMPFAEYMSHHLLSKDGVHQTGYLAQHDLMAQIPSLREDIAIPDYCFSTPPKGVGPSPRRESASSNSESPSESPEPPCVPLLNIWLGPGGTVSPAHTDPHHNIFTQVVGRKYVRLFPPSESTKLYPKGKEGGQDGLDMGNTSGVDVGLKVDFARPSHAPETNAGFGTDDNEVGLKERTVLKEKQRERFPMLDHADYVEGVLGEGECLYIPRGWWHYVESLDTSISVSFWWD